MRVRLVALLLCPVLAGCSLFMQLDKSKLDYYDEHVDVEEDFHEEGTPDVPSDFAYDGPCPDVPECWAHHDCNDGDPCTTDFCYIECNACVNIPIHGAAVTLEDLPLHNREERNQSPPRIAWTGTEWGVVWSRSISPGNGEVFFTSVSADGSEYVDMPIRVTDNGEDDIRPRIAWTGDRWAVAWIHDPEGTGQVLFTLITPGSFARTEFDVLHETTGHLSSVDLASSGDVIAIVHDSDIEADLGLLLTLLESDGTPVVSAATVVRGGHVLFSPSLAWSSTEFGLAWQEERGGEDYSDIYFIRIGADGTVLGTPFPIVYTPHRNEVPSIAWSGTGWGVAYHKRTDAVSPEIYFVHLSPTGSPDTEHQLTESDETDNAYPSLAHTGLEFGLLFNSDSELSLIRLNSDGTRIGVDTWINAYDRPAVLAGGLAWNGSRYAVAWEGDAGNWFNLIELCDP